MRFQKWHVASLSLFLGQVALATEVYPTSSLGSYPLMPNRAVNSNSEKPIRVNFHIKCVATNLRAPVIPAAATACITTDLQLVGRPLISVTFPALYLDPHPPGTKVPNPACTGPDRVPPGPNGLYQGVFAYGSVPPPPPTWKKSISMTNLNGGSLQLTVETDLYPEKLTVDDDGKFNMSAVPTKVSRFRMGQTGVMANSNGHYFGMNVDFPTAGSQIDVGSFGQEVDVYASVYGAAYFGQPAGQHRGHCGGLYSPLMLFFNKQRPKFHGVALFPLLSEPRTYAWPEANAPGYFLAFDKNKNGKVDGGEELFGEDDEGRYKNGFEKLKALDANKDGVIDAKDPLFSQLKLWRDKNSNGETNRGEIIPLGAKRVVKIELNYTSNTVIPVNGVAELREKADFYYYEDDGSLKKGEVFDVWLTPQSPQLAVQE